jgi:phage shock protein A
MMDKIEQPEEQLAVFVEELTGSMSKMQKGVAAAVADEKRLKLQIGKALESAQGWEQKAMLALKQGDETLARQALVRKEDAEAQARVLQASWKTQMEACEKLKVNLSQARVRLDDAKREYTLLLARYRSAQTKQKLTETMTLGSDESPMKYIEGLNDKILKIEAETEANLELIGENGAGDLEQQFARLEQAHRGEQALLDLKAKMQQQQLTTGDHADQLKAKLGS